MSPPAQYRYSFSVALTIIIVICFAGVNGHQESEHSNLIAQKLLLMTTNGTGLIDTSIPHSTREYWMRQANEALFTLRGPCPFAAFGSVIVNHTSQPDGSMGRLICIGANGNNQIGNPTLHGEIAAINNCSEILTSPAGYNLTAAQALDAFSDLTLYTNAESCPMCASAIRWSNFKEYVYGTTIDFLIEKGWRQIRISSHEIFDKSLQFPSMRSIIGNVLTEETDPIFSWQYDTGYACPAGCARNAGGASCLAL